MSALEAERTVLGAVLLDAKLYDSVADSLRPEHFERELHRRIWSAIATISDRGEELSLVAVRSELALACEQATELAQLVDGMPRLSDCQHWVHMVREAARRRAARTVTQRALDALGGGETTDEVLERLSGSVGRLLEAGDTRHTQPIATALKAAVADLDRWITTPSGITGIPTDLPDLDWLTGGLQRGWLAFIAARPRRGKSAFCAQVALAAARHGFTVLAFTLEMRPSRVAQRMLLSTAEVSRYELRSETGSSAWERVGRAMEALQGLPIFLDDREAPTLAQIKAAAKRVQSQHGLGLVIVDYLQRCTLGKADARYVQIGDLARGLKSLAMQMDVPVLAAVQVNRGGEDRKPTLADLRESGDLEQEPDLVGILHPHPMPGLTPEQIMDLEYPQVDLFVEKHRDGPEAAIPLSFEKRFVRFINMVRPEVSRDTAQAGR